jgi:hypothetical protein
MTLQVSGMVNESEKTFCEPQVRKFPATNFAAREQARQTFQFKAQAFKTFYCVAHHLPTPKSFLILSPLARIHIFIGVPQLFPKNKTEERRKGSFHKHTLYASGLRSARISPRVKFLGPVSPLLLST